MYTECSTGGYGEAKCDLTCIGYESCYQQDAKGRNAKYINYNCMGAYSCAEKNLDCSGDNKYSICNVGCYDEYSCEESTIEGRNSMYSYFGCFGDYSCFDSSIDCSDTNDLSECMIECAGNWSCSGGTSIDQLDAQYLSISCNETNSCNNLRIDCMDNDEETIDSECLLTCNEDSSCIGLEIDGENAMDMTVKCLGNYACYEMEADCPSISESECLIQCGLDDNYGTGQCFMAVLNAEESWNFTAIMNGNASCQDCTISGKANMNDDFMDDDDESDVIYNGTESSYYWMNIMVNGKYGLKNADIFGGKRDRIYIECNDDLSCFNVDYKISAFSYGDIYCDDTKKNVCDNGDYYCYDYISETESDKECIDNGVVFRCNNDNNNECDIAFDINYPTPGPTKAPTAPTAPKTTGVDGSKASIWSVFHSLIACIVAVMVSSI